MSQTLTIQLFDIASQVKTKKINDCQEREGELQRLVRLLQHPQPRHLLVIGEPGCGKTSFVHAFANRLIYGRYPELPQSIFSLDINPLINLLVDNAPIQNCVHALSKAADQLPDSIIIIEDIHLLIGDDQLRIEIMQRLLIPLMDHKQLKIIATATSTAYEKYLQKDYLFNRSFEPIQLSELSDEQNSRVIASAVQKQDIRANDTIIALAIKYGKRYARGRVLPDTALRIIDESILKCRVERRKEIRLEDINSILAQRENIRPSDIDHEEGDLLAQLETQLNQAILGQKEAIRRVTGIVLRSRLGLSDPTKPKGSFLALGPSGVGKTETARVLSEMMFETRKAFIRLDMSEFSEPHASIRLIGSPPGYVGYEEGGQLTNPIAREPHSLVLLDEIEKAHPKLFDLFLQVLDDGILTDSAGKTVAFNDTIIMATSNCASREIAASFLEGEDIQNPDYYHSRILPILFENFRPEFINRFDAILIYNPLSLDTLIQLAQIELQRLEKRLEKYHITFSVSNDVLRRLIKPLYHPLFGARPVKRVIEQSFEAPLAQYILARRPENKINITGSESWLSHH